MDFSNGKCPMCGTAGKLWHKEPRVFECPNCASLYSRFGLVMEAKKEPQDFWS